MKIKFLKSPTCNPYKLGYNIGDVAEIKDKELVDTLIKEKFAEVFTASPKTEKAVKGGGEKAVKTESDK